MQPLATTLGYALLLGATCGARSMLPIAVLAQAARRRRVGRRLQGPLRALRSRSVQIGLGVAASGEMIADKLPWTPSRVSPPALLGRCATGAIAGAAVFSVGRRDPIVGALVGAAAAWLGATLTHELRVAGGRRDAPHRVRGLIEDAAVFALSRAATA